MQVARSSQRINRFSGVLRFKFNENSPGVKAYIQYLKKARLQRGGHKLFTLHEDDWVEPDSTLIIDKTSPLFPRPDGPWRSLWTLLVDDSFNILLHPHGENLKTSESLANVAARVWTVNEQEHDYVFMWSRYKPQFRPKSYAPPRSFNGHIWFHPSYPGQPDQLGFSVYFEQTQLLQAKGEIFSELDFQMAELSVMGFLPTKYDLLMASAVFRINDKYMTVVDFREVKRTIKGQQQSIVWSQTLEYPHMFSKLTGGWRVPWLEELGTPGEPSEESFAPRISPLAVKVSVWSAPRRSANSRVSDVDRAVANESQIPSTTKVVDMSLHPGGHFMLVYLESPLKFSALCESDVGKVDLSIRKHAGKFWAMAQGPIRKVDGLKLHIKQGDIEKTLVFSR